MTVAVPVVHDKSLGVLKVADKLLKSGQQFGLLGTVIGGEFPAQAFKPPQCRVGTAVPEVPFDPMQRIDQRVGTRPFVAYRQPLCEEKNN